MAIDKVELGYQKMYHIHEQHLNNFNESSNHPDPHNKYKLKTKLDEILFNTTLVRLQTTKITKTQLSVDQQIEGSPI